MTRLRGALTVVGLADAVRSAGAAVSRCVVSHRLPRSSGLAPRTPKAAGIFPATGEAVDPSSRFRTFGKVAAGCDVTHNVSPWLSELFLRSQSDERLVELYAGCGNQLLVRMLDDLRDQTALVSVSAWRHDPDWLQTPSWEHEAAEHRTVLQAAEEGDAERAAALLSGHITSFVARNFPEPQENQNV